MGNFEERIARALAATEQAGDEEFVRKVARRVESDERMRRTRLTIATLAVGCLAVTLGYGVAKAWTAWRAIWSPAPEVLSIAMPLLSCAVLLLAAILLLPPARTRE